MDPFPGVGMNDLHVSLNGTCAGRQHGGGRRITIYLPTEKPIRAVDDRMEMAVRYPIIASASHNDGAGAILATSSIVLVLVLVLALSN